MARVPTWRGGSGAASRARNASARQAPRATQLPPSTAFPIGGEYVAPEPAPASARLTEANDVRVTEAGDRRVTE